MTSLRQSLADGSQCAGRRRQHPALGRVAQHAGEPGDRGPGVRTSQPEGDRQGPGHCEGRRRSGLFAGQKTFDKFPRWFRGRCAAPTQERYAAVGGHTSAAGAADRRAAPGDFASNGQLLCPSGPGDLADQVRHAGGRRRDRGRARAGRRLRHARDATVHRQRCRRRTAASRVQGHAAVPAASAEEPRSRSSSLPPGGVTAVGPDELGLLRPQGRAVELRDRPPAVGLPVHYEELARPWTPSSTAAS